MVNNYIYIVLFCLACCGHGAFVCIRLHEPTFVALLAQALGKTQDLDNSKTILIFRSYGSPCALTVNHDLVGGFNSLKQYESVGSL